MSIKLPWVQEIHYNRAEIKLQALPKHSSNISITYTSIHLHKTFCGEFSSYTMTTNYRDSENDLVLINTCRHQYPSRGVTIAKSIPLLIRSVWQQTMLGTINAIYSDRTMPWVTMLGEKGDNTNQANLLIGHAESQRLTQPLATGDIYIPDYWHAPAGTLS